MRIVWSPMEVLIGHPLEVIPQKKTHPPKGEEIGSPPSLFFTATVCLASNFKRGCISAIVRCTAGEVHPRFVYIRALFLSLFFSFSSFLFLSLPVFGLLEWVVEEYIWFGMEKNCQGAMARCWEGVRGRGLFWGEGNVSRKNLALYLLFLFRLILLPYRAFVIIIIVLFFFSSFFSFSFLSLL